MRGLSGCPGRRLTSRDNVSIVGAFIAGTHASERSYYCGVADYSGN